MTWQTRHQIRHYLRGSAWPIPTAAIPIAIAVKIACRALDKRTSWTGLAYSTAEASALLAAITPAALTLVALILSMLLLAVQLASSQLSPRLISGMLARGPVKACLFIMVFTYIFCAAIAGRVPEQVSQLSVVVAIASTILSVAAGLFLVDYFASELRPVRMLARTADTGRSVIEHVYPLFMPGGATVEPSEARDPPSLPDSSETVTRSGRSGVLLAVNVKGLASLARRVGGAIEIVPQVGDFVARNDPLFHVYPGLKGVPVTRFAELVIVGNERTYEQDPAFAFRVLVDVAAKALSAAINDPTTAVLAIDQIHHLLRQVGRRRLDTGELRDPDGTLRILCRTPDWDDFVHLAVTEIRQYGSGSIQVARRLRAMLDNLIASVPPVRVPILQEQLRLLQNGVARSFTEPEDRLNAEHADYQGMGGRGENGKGNGTTPTQSLNPPPLATNRAV